MHPEAFEYIRQQIERYLREVPNPSVVEFGSCDVNGSPRALLGSASTYTGIDLVSGPGVDIVADAAHWEPDMEYDLCVCTEVLEHTADWEQVCWNAYRALKPEGFFLVTCAGDPREPHSAVDGWALRDGEYYHNVNRLELAEALIDIGFSAVSTDSHPRGDTYAFAVK